MASQPEYGVAVSLDVRMETRDGIELSTDVYRPADPDTGEPIDEQVPGLLYRTPYDKRLRGSIEEQGRYYAKRGYVVALQDVRGRFESEGAFSLLRNEAEDGYDAVEWLASHPACDGQVGTMGTSYMAWAQNALATQDPPHLEAMFVNQGGANAWEATLRHNGAVELRWLTWAFTLGGGFAKEALDDPDLQRLFAETDTRDVLAGEPLLEGQSPLRHLPDYEEWALDLLGTGGEADLWDEPSLNFEAHYDRMADVPTVYSGGWYDSYTKATVDNFEALADRKESDHYLVMGPWTHGWTDAWDKPHSGDVHFGEAARTDYLETRLEFFDHYLKGTDDWAGQPRVRFFRMGTGSGERTGSGRLDHGGAWEDASEWPPETGTRTYFAAGDGTLSTDRPQGSATTYEFDPRDPVPTIGGNCSSYYHFEQREETIEAYPLEERRRVSITGRGGYDQRTDEETFGAARPHGPLEERNDVLVYRTTPLDEPVEVAGPIRVTVYGSTDGPDTDFTAKLVDEHPPSADHPEGFALNLTDSICRGRYRGWRRAPDFLEPGEVYAFEMELYPTANLFKEGHRIRLDISSSNYPRYDVNHNTGGPLYGDRTSRVARNTVHHGGDHATRIELPVRSA